ncbi:hypothetical protein CPI04_02460 [Moraxella catarrhalis]|nr:hypothetical protein [Moraxella catarrhalis]MPW72288.1 hypothetical protein [Moraxella catarrhalis]
MISKTYEIVEQDAVEQIQQKLKQMEATGELARLESCCLSFLATIPNARSKSLKRFYRDCGKPPYIHIEDGNSKTSPYHL